MPKNFLKLTKVEQSEIITTLSVRMGREPQIIEKDIWVCWVLKQLFEMPNALPMAFKGGTSLSKVFDVIQRFSEDVDITIDYRAFKNSTDPFSDAVSKTALSKLSDKLKKDLASYIHEIVKPYFSELIEKEFNGDVSITVSDNGEACEIEYPSVTETSKSYISPRVLLEFGARNVTEPNEQYNIKTYIAELIPELELPTAVVPVLSPQRTFWEKATLMHVECNRKEYKQNANRLSRHWYDLMMLSNHVLGKKALKNRILLAEVIKHKKVFYNSSYANYDDCLLSKFRLVPEQDHLLELEKDYQQMVLAGMFQGETIAFKKIIDNIKTVESNINRQ